MTAVERFAKRHDAGETPPSGCYEALIPLAKPKAGEQYGFRVDLDACTGCKACVAACHSLNGLDEVEPRAVDIGELRSALLRQGVYLNNSERKPCQTEARHLSAPIT